MLKIKKLQKEKKEKEDAAAAAAAAAAAETNDGDDSKAAEGDDAENVFSLSKKNAGKKKKRGNAAQLRAQKDHSEMDPFQAAK